MMDFIFFIVGIYYVAKLINERISRKKRNEELQKTFDQMEVLRNSLDDSELDRYYVANDIKYCDVRDIIRDAIVNSCPDRDLTKSVLFGTYEINYLSALKGNRIPEHDHIRQLDLKEIALALLFSTKGLLPPMWQFGSVSTVKIGNLYGDTQRTKEVLAAGLGVQRNLMRHGKIIHITVVPNNIDPDYIGYTSLGVEEFSIKKDQKYRVENINVDRLVKQ